jgi:hypothetical protein
MHVPCVVAHTKSGRQPLGKARRLGFDAVLGGHVVEEVLGRGGEERPVGRKA